MQQAYSFPILKNKEILMCLKELSIPFTKEDLKAPEAATMRVVYDTFVEILMGVTKEDLRQPHFNAVVTLPHPELHEESIGEILWQKSLLKLMEAVGLYDCTIRDFLSPTAGRTKRILSALINFAKFREERLTTYQEFTVQTDELIEEKDKLRHEHEQLTAMLNELKELRKEEEPEIKELEDATAALAVEINELNQTHTQLRDGISTLKDESNEVAQQVADTENQVTNEQKECDKFKSQIVRSPKKLKQALVDMGNQMESTKMEITDATKKLRTHQTKFQMISGIDSHLVARMSQMEECKAELEKIQNLQLEIEQQKAKLESDDCELREQKATEAHLKKQINNTQDKLFRLQRQFETKRHAAQIALSQVQNEKLVLERSINKDKLKAEQNSQLLRRKQADFDELKCTHEEEMDLLRSKYMDLAVEVQSFHDRMMLVINSEGDKGSVAAITGPNAPAPLQALPAPYSSSSSSSSSPPSSSSSSSASAHSSTPKITTTPATNRSISSVTKTTPGKSLLSLR